MQPDFVQDALHALRPDDGDWYRWAKLDADGNKIPSDQRMCWEHTVVIKDGVTKPTKEEFDAKYNELVNAYPMQQLRAARNRKLADTDWWVLPDRTPTQAQLDYRQALRDITNTYTSLDDVVWPTKPS